MSDLSHGDPSHGDPLPPLVVIGGATATGKTSLSLRLAEALRDAEIISADSRQVYRGMDIGTAKPAPEARRLIPHHGLDLVDPPEPFSVADFQRHALQTLAGIAARGRVAVLVGGTGLYLRAVARGLDLAGDAPDPAARAALESDLAERGLVPLVAELRRLAPTLATATDLANPRRVVRALERARTVGDRLPPPPRGYPAPVLWLGLRLEPAAHGDRLAERARGQFDNGLVEEASMLTARYPPDLRAFSAFGYREAFDLLAGQLTREEAVRRTVVRTSQYARRQGTWFRAEPDIHWIDPASALPLAWLRRGITPD
ncbi:tRNA (adenosine(37)-N6)-dimethylallyltransferase MiaA [soil metagenome]